MICLLWRIDTTSFIANGTKRCWLITVSKVCLLFVVLTFCAFLQRNPGVGEYGYRNNHFTPVTSANDVYGFAERREAEGSEDFDAVPDDLRFNPRESRLSSTLPSHESRGASTTSGKNVRFDAFSAPTSPYGYHTGGAKFMTSQIPHSHSSDSVRNVFVCMFASSGVPCTCPGTDKKKN